jgi:DNA topoisomerase-1
MSKNLVIVESPAKAKTIEKYLGKDYEVVASYGHIRDLPKKGMSIDIEHDFVPTYDISDDKKKTVADLRKRAKAADTVWLASDEDREGEAIAWHICMALKLDPKTTKRIVFHEITEGAIKQAVANPRTVDQNLVDAQQARRVLDRLVGYELSPILWKKIRTGLSAGRVQSVAVRIIVEREREIENFTPASSYRVLGQFKSGKDQFRAELPKRLGDETAATTLLNDAAKSTFTVKNVETKPGKKSPAAPFTTSTLQQEASRKLGFSVRQTMTIAQKLYESGAITYMRTDSVHLSETAQSGAVAEIKKAYGDHYVATRQFTTKSAGAQEAHEAIRPTDFGRRSAGDDNGAKRLYELIWQRSIASQMAEAIVEKTVATIALSENPAVLEAKGEVIKFDGFLSVYLEGKDHDDEVEAEGILPPLEVGQTLDLIEMKASQTFSRAKPRYTEASLVKKLEEEGIGRPSTYAPTISTIQDRGYVEKGDREGSPRDYRVIILKDGKVTASDETENTGVERSKLFPTPIGSLVNDLLVKHFPDVVDYQFTAKVEDEFDEIEEGKKPWNKMISEFYGPFHKSVVAAEGISREEASGARDIGIDPKSGKPIIARMGRFGPMLQIGSAEDEEKPKFAPLPPGTTVETVTMEEALELFKLPRVVGQTPDGQEITANLGRFGPYVKFGSTFVSIKPDDPFSITAERANELIAEKIAADAAKTINIFADGAIKVLNGRFGPYITDGKKNAKIPKDTDPATLDEATCRKLLEEAPAAKARRFTRKKK